MSSGATLTIDAGTLIRAWGPNAAIIVDQGGRIVVRGRREAPVVMTCSLPVGKRRPGCWGGLVVRGTATAGIGLGREGGAPPGVGVADGLGGAASASGSSGELRYLRVEFAGGGSLTATPASAVAFEGVGARTVIDHVQAHASAGDGFAFRGGAAHCSYCVSSDTRGNSVAWSLGWQGSMQHLYVQQGAQGASGMHGSAASEALPGAMPTFYNVTLIGGYNIGVLGGAPGRQDSIGPGIFLEAEAGMNARNLLVTGFAGFAIDGPAASFVSGRSSVANSILTNSGYRHGSSSPGPRPVRTLRGVHQTESGAAQRALRAQPGPTTAKRIGRPPAWQCGSAAPTTATSCARRTTWVRSARRTGSRNGRSSAANRITRCRLTDTQRQDGSPGGGGRHPIPEAMRASAVAVCGNPAVRHGRPNGGPVR